MKYLIKTTTLTLLFLLAGSFTAMPVYGANTGDKVLDRQPKILKKVQPKYPPETKQKGIEGIVKIKALIDAAGKASQIEIAQTSGDASLDQAALEAAKQWAFAPAMQAGKPVEASIAFDISFVRGKEHEAILPKPDEFVAADVEPKMMYKEMPVYPKEAEQQGITGVVGIKTLVGTDGKPTQVIVAKSSGYDFLDKAALTAAEKCKFKAATKGGQPVAMWVSYEVKFTK